ncbi:2TM domain-containing protein [Variovorax sp. H27-G14]|uniref:2TM domain-containing protein n=1 Tax=Variovorax sp. H27-G14 TaxID=3111914 RepID=UPI0038FC3CFE
MNTPTPTATANPAPTSGRSPSEVERLARRRAGAKMGWYTHAFFYVLVNLGLVGLSAASGHTWAIYPLMGWGLGLLAHGAAVWVVAPGGGFYNRLVERERRALGAGNSGNRG